MGVVKETGEDDHHILTFYDKYFRYPLFKDNKWTVYKNLLGNRYLSMARMYEGLRKIEWRYKKKNIPNEMGGDHHTQGGLLFFDRKGNLRYVYEEQYGEELDMELIQILN